MRFYTVSDDYIAFLQKHDDRVPNNGGAGYTVRKSYVGVVLEIGTHKFLAPLTSYKPNQDKIDSSSCAAFKLHERTRPENKLGMIALRYMIPVHEAEITELDVNAQDDRYKRMLMKQYEFIKTNKEEIANRAAKLYEHVVIKRTPFYVRLSCDIPKLVDNYKNYNAGGNEVSSTGDAEQPAMPEGNDDASA